ncbi:MAG: hypothetical protein ACKOOF_00235, partial [Planctomycetaceae bacterium]
MAAPGFRPSGLSTPAARTASLALVALALAGGGATGQEAAAPAAVEELSFLRVARDADDRPVSLDTAIVSY